MGFYTGWLKSERWRALWIALRRAPRDRHARRNLLRIAASLVFICLWLGWYAFFFGGAISDLGPSVVVVMVAAILVVVLVTSIVAWKQRLDDRIARRSDPAVSAEMKRVVFRETVLLGTLLERLGSEIAMEKELPQEIVVITRRVMLDRLDHLHLRDSLEPELLDLLLAPDGHWTAEQKVRAGYAWEYFEVLSWALGLSDLRELISEPRYNVDDIRSLCAIRKPERLLLLPSWDLRPARDAALKFLNRCWAELLARKQISSATSEIIAEALELRSSIEEKGYTADYVIGSRTISELDTPLLRTLAARGWRRRKLLSLLVQIVSEESPITELRAMVTQQFAPPNAAEQDEAQESA